MNIIGHLIALTGLYILYAGEIVFGGILFFFGGFLAKKLFFSLRSAGVMTMVIAIAHGFHHGFTPIILLIAFVGFVLACFNTRRSNQRSDGGWGFDIEFSDFGSGSDGGGDCGGGGD